MSEQDLYNHAAPLADPCSFATSNDCPYFRLWIRNYDSEKISGTLDYADETQKEFTVPAAGAAGYSDYLSQNVTPGSGGHSVGIKGEAGYEMSGKLSIHVFAEEASMYP